jgi:hypothetical protein
MKVSKLLITYYVFFLYRSTSSNPVSRLPGYQVEPTEDDQDGDDLHEPSLRINYPMKIFGAGQNKTLIQGGGFEIEVAKEGMDERVEIQGLAVIASGNGLYIHNFGLSFLCKDMTFTQCGFHGVYANNTKGRFINCVITQCGYSGIRCWNGLVELEGSQTKVDGNGAGAHTFGLYTCDTSAIIHLLFPLTKESVFTNNHDGRNYGGRGSIQTVDALEPL